MATVSWDRVKVRFCNLVSQSIRAASTFDRTNVAEIRYVYSLAVGFLHRSKLVELWTNQIHRRKDTKTRPAMRKKKNGILSFSRCRQGVNNRDDELPTATTPSELKTLFLTDKGLRIFVQPCMESVPKISCLKVTRTNH